MQPSFSKHFFTSSVYVALLFTTCNIFFSVLDAKDLAPNTNTRFIETSCSATTYPKLCLTSLSSQASFIQTSPKLIACVALNVSLLSAKATSSMMLSLSHAHGMKPREAAAMRDCIEMVSDSVDEIRRSISEMVNFRSIGFEMMISDVQTWVSDALTDETTCSDGFAGNELNGNLKNVVRGRIVEIAHLTSNALALINRYASAHS